MNCIVRVQMLLVFFCFRHLLLLLTHFSAICARVHDNFIVFSVACYCCIKKLLHHISPCFKSLRYVRSSSEVKNVALENYKMHIFLSSFLQSVIKFHSRGSRRNHKNIDYCSQVTKACDWKKVND